MVRAKTCWKLVHDLDGPSYDDLGEAIQMNLIKNNPVITKYVKLTEVIFGIDVSILKGKQIKPHPCLVTKEDEIDLPEELRVSETELAADVVYIEDQAFITCIDRKVKFEGVVAMDTFKKFNSEQPMSGLDDLIHRFKKRMRKLLGCIWIMSFAS